MRVIVYTGKGGVGKTSIAAATAVRLAKQGLRTLVLSTDAAHSLADSLDVSLGPDPVPVAPNLWGQEVDALREAERNWGAMQRYLKGLMEWAKLQDVTTEELLVFPGFEELFSLLQIREQAESGRFDVIVVDCAPTGETLKLLSYPGVMHWWLEKFFPIQRMALKVARPVAKLAMGGLELPDDSVADGIQQFVRKLGEMHALLADASVTSIRLVVNPEKMVIAEARRSFTYLNLFGFNTDAVIVNRVLPPGVGDGYMAGWREIQAKYEQEINIAFAPLPILRVPFMETEVLGLPMLERVGDAAFGERDAGAILHEGRVEQMVKEPDGGYALELAVPFASREEIHLTQRGDELTVQVGAYKHKLTLPRTLLGRPVLGARFADDKLRVRFGERPAATDPKEG
jgi:arsenite/tail-anchored protein-transporting ATPase